MRDQQLIEARRVAASRLGEPAVRDMVPSQREFLRAIAKQRRGLSFIALAEDERDVARAADAAVGALATHDAVLRHAAAARAPLLAFDACVARSQVYAARIAGADAVLLPACLPVAELEALVSATKSTRMTAVFDVVDASELEMALELRPRAVLLPDPQLALRVGHGIATIVPVRTAHEARELRGIVDAALATRQLVLGGAFQSLVSELDR